MLIGLFDFELLSDIMTTDLKTYGQTAVYHITSIKHMYTFNMLSKKMLIMNKIKNKNKKNITLILMIHIKITKLYCNIE